jgi:hypothetical protein
VSRIRSIHPGLWTDEAFVSLSPLARLLFVGSWNECDDKGLFPWSPLKLKMRVLPADNIDASDLLAEMETAGLVRRYEFDGKTFGVVRNFARYQRPKKPNDLYPASAEILLFAGMNTEQATLLASSVPNQFPTNGEIDAQREEGGGNRSSEANASGAEAPNLTPADMTKAIWDTGKTILKAAGHDDRHAGSIIGRFRKTYSDSQVLTVLSRCQSEQPSEPVEWITKALQFEQAKCAGSTANGQHPTNQRASVREIAERAVAGRNGSSDSAVGLLPGPRAASWHG